MAVSMVAILTVGLLGIVPLAIGVMLLIMSRRRGPGYPACGKCGYNVGASIESGSRCPECGSTFADVGITPPAGAKGGKVALRVIGLLLLAPGVVVLAFTALAIWHAVMEP